jgi:hypothetical protein
VADSNTASWYAEQLALALKDVIGGGEDARLAAWGMLQQYADWRERQGLDPYPFRDPEWVRGQNHARGPVSGEPAD